MSLELAAKHLAAKGRGPDTMLVHMAPGEVNSLQEIARAHGGTLTTNPDTGLPEAGFLSSILPMIAGVALGPAGFGLTAMQAGLAAGAAGSLATGSLRKGLMAGLGAYGGAGLGGGLMAAGATPATAQGLMASDAAAQAAMGSGANAKDLLLARGTVGGAAPTFGQNLSQMGRGLSNLFSDSAARDAFMADVGGGKGLLRYGAAAAAPAMMAPPEKTPMPTMDSEQYRYAYDAGRVDEPYGPYTGAATGERTYFRPSFTRMAEGGMAYADGGPISQLINSDAFDQAAAQQAGLSQYTYDPVAQRYSPRVVTATQVPKDIAYAGQGISGGGGDSAQQPSAWSQMSPAQQAAFYSENPRMGAVTQFGQKAFGMTMPGQAQKAMAPDFVRQQELIAMGIDPSSIPTEAQMVQGLMNAEFSPHHALNSVNENYTAVDPGTGRAYDAAGFGAYGENAAPAAYDSTGFGAYGENASPDSGGAPDSGGGLDSQGASADTGSMDSGGGIGFAHGGISALMAQGGMSHLGDYSDGGRLLRGPGDGVSDSIPAVIGRKRPARLADGEFVVPARIVSELGNGSTEAGARKLYAMMDRIQKNRAKSIGKGKVAVNSRSEKLLPA